ncbi:hypothetical protein IWQ60_009072 [Tieghemiomyces parasiticus]|uniref:Condensin complex subunit 2 n=1 Tax=Tieghemiomyces parasiticus TaxID=78921 RepID=A0A9W7ZXM3_9FUNG|nr:hypothetical protein IWQ60_009072 [Tieghemiomyces parasiticus]
MVSAFTGPFQTPKRSGFVDAEIPLKDAAHWNDDQAERRARRRSGVDNKKRRSMLLSPQSAAKSFQTPNRKSLTQPLQVVGAGAVHTSSPGSALKRLTPEELNQRYEEWMKIAADNKINVNNTWDVALIDYFHDMSLLRDGDSINFQKASCTLDGCVKIYASRVDSVATETGKLLNGLADNPHRRNRNGLDGTDSGADAEDDDDDDEDRGGVNGAAGANGRRTGAKHRRRANQGESTLAKDFAAISVKKFDLEFAVDPLFKKTSADFDEGGARGLLLNHLTLDASGKIIFDAGDAAVTIGDDDEPEGTTAEGGELPVFVPATIDYTHLQNAFFGDLSRAMACDICPSLKTFEFAKDDSLDIVRLKQALLDETQETHAEEETNPLADDGPAFEGPDDDDDDGGAGFAFGEEVMDAEGTMVPPYDGAPADDTTYAGHHATDIHAQPKLSLADLKDDQDLFSYFDTKLIKSWAGPDHWKLHPALRTKPPTTGEDGTTKDVKKPRTERTAYHTDFLTQPDLDEDQLFAAPSRAGSLILANGYLKTGTRGSRHLLPDDIQFTSKNMTTLFLKPRFRVRSWLPNSQGDLPFTMVHPVHAGGTEDLAAIAAAATETGPNGLHPPTDLLLDGDPGAHLHVDGDVDGGGNDVDDDLDDGMGGFGLEMDAGDELVPSTQMTQFIAEGDIEPTTLMPQLKVIKPLYVNYARTAKRVDVKKLKDNLWHKMTSMFSSRRQSAPAAVTLAELGDEDVVPKTNAAADGDDDDGDKVADETAATDEAFPLDPEAAPPAVHGEQRFTDVMDGLKTLYPEQSIRDISVPFCFICLLHLANEKNLRIEEDGTLADLLITQDEQLSIPTSY